MATYKDLMSDVTRELGSAVNHVASTRLPENIEMYFNQIIFLNLQPDNIAFQHLNEKNERNRWLRKLNDRVPDVRRTLRILYYHCYNLRALEQRIGEAAAPILHAAPEQRSFVVAAGEHENLDAEFHAFHFAVGRMLEYFTLSVSSLFCMEMKSLRRLLPKISSAIPVRQGLAIAERIRSFEDEIGHFWNKSDTTKPTRDWLAHYHYVEPGFLNMSRSSNGTVLIALFGGPNDLNGIKQLAEEQGDWDDGTTRILTPLSDKMFQEVETLTRMILLSFGDLGIWTAPLSGGVPAFRNAKF